MAKDNAFLLVSLEEEKAKKLAQVITNDVCRSILDRLVKKEATETELSRALGVPISTVHYNIRQLVESGLVVAEEFHYSEKGREVNHYKLANKHIIITTKPSEKESLPAAVRKVLPVFLITVVAAGVLHLLTRAMTVFEGTAERVTQPFAATKIQQVAYNASDTAAQAAARIAAQQPSVSVALWFIVGAMFALAALVIYEKVIKKKH